MPLERNQHAESSGIAEDAKLIHDLAQPLSAIRCAVDVALLRERPTSEYIVALREIQAVADFAQSLLIKFRDAER